MKPTTRRPDGSEREVQDYANAYRAYMGGQWDDEDDPGYLTAHYRLIDAEGWISEKQAAKARRRINLLDNWVERSFLGIVAVALLAGWLVDGTAKVVVLIAGGAVASAVAGTLVHLAGRQWGYTTANDAQHPDGSVEEVAAFEQAHWAYTFTDADDPRFEADAEGVIALEQRISRRQTIRAERRNARRYRWQQIKRWITVRTLQQKGN